MALTKLTTDLENIQALSDKPNEIEGLTADELKAKFDKAGSDIKTYINENLTEEVDTALGLKAPLVSPTFTGTVSLPSSTSIGNVSSTEIGYLDGVAAPIQDQISTRLEVFGASSFDCNTIKTTSIRPGYNCSNAPTAAIGILQTMTYSVDWVQQVFWAIGNDEMWTRTWYAGTTWGTWTKRW